jgi:hypothetical protein
MPFRVLQKTTLWVNFLSRGQVMLLRNYIETLDRQSLERYAKRCGIATSYLRMHVKYASKDPSVSLIKSLARESDGYVSLAEVLEHFGINESSTKTPHRKKAA